MFSRGFATKAGQCYYKVLGVRPGASRGEVKSAFVDLSKKHHPDVNHTSTGEDFIEICEAYNVLSHPVKRHHYDLMHGLTAGHSPLYTGGLEHDGLKTDLQHKADRTKHYKVVLWLVAMMVLASAVHTLRIHWTHKQQQERSFEETRKNNDIYLQVRQRAQTSSVQQQLHRLAASHKQK